MLAQDLQTYMEEIANDMEGLVYRNAYRLGQPDEKAGELPVQRVCVAGAASAEELSHPRVSERHNGGC